MCSGHIQSVVSLIGYTRFEMVKTAEVPISLREKVISFHKTGISVRKIASRLDLP